MLSRLELSYEAHHRLLAYCAERKIEFLSTAFDSESLDFLVNDLKLKTLKIPSGEITNAPFILDHARTGCDLIVSTGMSDLADIEAALGVIAFGYTADEITEPSIQAFKQAYASAAGQDALKRKVTLLHCTSEYPAPLSEVNLRVMDTLAQAFGLAAGYSDHTAGIAISVAAVARGATLVEKHFTLDREMEGPDHKASLEPEELASMVAAIRAVEIALGTAIKSPTGSELKNRNVVRKSLVAVKDISQGEAYSENNIAAKRPGTGISPFKYWNLLGKKAERDLSSGDLIDG
jgi:N-acetylneuraminate synthase